ncbi:MAG: hypothetical protein WBV82_09925 [Myxococcaceae bacterium]
MRFVPGCVLLVSTLVACGGPGAGGEDELSGEFHGTLIFTESGTDAECRHNPDSVGSCEAVLVRQSDGKYLLTVNAPYGHGTYEMVRSGDGARSEEPITDGDNWERTASVTLNAARDELNITVLEKELKYDCTKTGVGVMRRVGTGADAGQ